MTATEWPLISPALTTFLNDRCAGDYNVDEINDLMIDLQLLSVTVPLPRATLVVPEGDLDTFDGPIPFTELPDRIFVVPNMFLVYENAEDQLFITGWCDVPQEPVAIQIYAFEQNQ